MNEQSHKEEMSAAIRGDFQRLRERGVPVTLAPPTTLAPDEERRVEVPRDEPPEEPAPAEPSGEEPSPADAPPPRRSWLARLTGR